MSIRKITYPKYKNPKQGFNTDNTSFYFYARIGRVLYYDSVYKMVDVLWLDGAHDRYGSKIPISFSQGSYGNAFKVNDRVVCIAERGNVGNGSYIAVGVLASDTEVTRTLGLYFNNVLDDYVFAYDRILENGDAYLKSGENSELYLDENVSLSTASGVGLEMVSSEQSMYSSARNYQIYGTGVWGNIGMNYLPSAFLSGDDDYTLKSVAPNELDSERDINDFESAIKPSILEDGKRLYTVTDDDSKKTLNDDDVKPFNEFDFFMEEKSEPIPLVDDSSGVFHEDFMKSVDESGDKGHIIRFGFGTKIGKNPEDKKQYGRPLKRNLFKGFETEELEEDKDKKQEPITEKKKNIFSTAFWVNLFRKGKEIAFLELDKSGCLKFLFDGKKPEDSGEGDERYFNSIEGRLNGRLKLSFGKHEPKSSSSSSSDDGDLPKFDQNEKRKVEGDSVFGYFNSGLNLYVDGKDGASGGYFLDCIQESNYKLRVTGDYHRELAKKEKVKVTGRSYHTYGAEMIRTAKKQSIIKSSAAMGIQGSPLNLVSATSSGIIKLGLGAGAKINEDSGEIEGATETIKSSFVSGSEEKPAKDGKPAESKANPVYTLDFGRFDVTFKSTGKMIFDCSGVEVGTGGLKPVGVEGSLSSVRAADYGVAVLNNDLAPKLKVSKGGSSGGMVDK